MSTRENIRLIARAPFKILLPPLGSALNVLHTFQKAKSYLFHVEFAFFQYTNSICTCIYNNIISS